LTSGQSLRCRDILTRLAGRPEVSGPESSFLQQPLAVIIAPAAEPHRATAANVSLEIHSHGDPGSEPRLEDRPALLHGLGNLIQNALQFASRHVSVEISWDVREVAVTIRDDGPGFPEEILDQSGDPYLSLRDKESEGKVHMGLRLFIAETLLQRTGAVLRFSNPAGGGAEVAVRWKRATLAASALKGAGSGWVNRDVLRH